MGALGSEAVLRLQLPERCKFCGAVGSVRLEQTIKARSVTVAWCCNLCDRGWPVSAAEFQPERRGADADRRNTPRSDRRGRRPT